MEISCILGGGQLAFFAIGSILPIAAYAIFYWYQGGNFGDWFYWNVIFIFSGPYAREGRLLPTLAQIWQLVPALALVLPYGLGVFHADKDAGPSRAAIIWLFIFMLTASIFIYPRYSGRHWAAAFPFLTAIAGIVCSDIVDVARHTSAKFFQWGLSITIVLLCFLQGVYIYGPQILTQKRW